MKVGYLEPLAGPGGPCGSLGRRGGGVPGSLRCLRRHCHPTLARISEQRESGIRPSFRGMRAERARDNLTVLERGVDSVVSTGHCTQSVRLRVHWQERPQIGSV